MGLEFTLQTIVTIASTISICLMGKDGLVVCLVNQLQLVVVVCLVNHLLLVALICLVGHNLFKVVDCLVELQEEVKFKVCFVHSEVGNLLINQELDSNLEMYQHKIQMPSKLHYKVFHHLECQVTKIRLAQW